MLPLPLLRVISAEVEGWAPSPTSSDNASDSCNIKENLFYQFVYCKRNDKLGNFSTALRYLTSS